MKADWKVQVALPTLLISTTVPGIIFSAGDNFMNNTSFAVNTGGGRQPRKSIILNLKKLI
ncbi:hypothetical protein [Candidatus Mycoplasma haematominutum]|uniref:hypothetical protein n=1 Tax=Candidatus Mycoplasma haematominutum TaxID=209446 RepID=UPI0005C5A857|nr:hypothetical protein [Candidatus Mycoplasma haematominutum]